MTHQPSERQATLAEKFQAVGVEPRDDRDNLQPLSTEKPQYVSSFLVFSISPHLSVTSSNDRHYARLNHHQTSLYIINQEKWCCYDTLKDIS